MSATAMPIDEDARMTRFLSAEEPEATRFEDDLHARLASACFDAGASDLEVAVLFRQLVRRRSIEMGGSARVVTAPHLSVRLRRVAAGVRLREPSANVWSAAGWRPDWLDAVGLPDGASAAGTSVGRRFREDALIADPFFHRLTGHAHYRTPGQRAACRAVVSVPQGSTVIAMLPTGSGKTEVALCLADRHRPGVTLIIVPTTALAYDFERRFQEHFSRGNHRVDKTGLRFAWTSETDEELRQRIRARVEDGTQRILVTSPESMTRSLRALLEDCARSGLLGGLVIDEAHLVTQWGRDFRPEFRSLVDLRQVLIEHAASSGDPVPTTLLLSATLGAHELKDLYDLFGAPGPCTLVAANALRAEPELWISEAPDGVQRRQRVLDALAHLPRPAILYVTSPDTAEEWADTLNRVGYRRLAVVTSRTSVEERSRVLTRLRNAGDDPPALDLVVATSAFGLGIDYAHVRTVIHACLPETTDRWYQEVGRGGRDGDVSGAFLLTAPEDRDEAASLRTKVLRAPTAKSRWKDLWGHRKEFNSKYFVDLEGSSGASKVGTYNRRWHAQLVQGLVELGALKRDQFDFEDLIEVFDKEIGSRQEWIPVLPQAIDLESDEFWEEKWQSWQKAEGKRSDQAFEVILSLSNCSVDVCKTIADAYAPDGMVRELFGPAAEYVRPLTPCGRCPTCRRNGVAPPDDPPPWPRQVWPVPGSAGARLDDLAAVMGTSDGLILLVSDDIDGVAPLLAEELLRRGVRHVAGPLARMPQYGDWYFRDDSPIVPTDLTPHSSFVVYPRGVHVPQTWRNPRKRAAHRQHAPSAFDVLLTPRDATLGGDRVEQDLRALDARIALQFLGGKS